VKLKRKFLFDLQFNLWQRKIGFHSLRLKRFVNDGELTESYANDQSYLFDSRIDIMQQHQHLFRSPLFTSPRLRSRILSPQKLHDPYDGIAL
jgi:hypothetical protein